MFTRASSTSCDLCGLPLGHGRISATVADRRRDFCCQGCRQVFTILAESSDSADPSGFRQSDLYRQCVAQGILPAPQDDRRNIAVEGTAGCAGPSPGTPPENTASGDTAAREKTTLDLSLAISGMWCPACAWVVEEMLKKTSGVYDAHCNFSTDRLVCRYDPLAISPERIRRRISRLGYTSAQPAEVQDSGERRREWLRLGISAALTMNVMMLSYAVDAGFFAGLAPDTLAKLSWPVFLMTTIVLFYGGGRIFRAAAHSLATAAWGMETLIAIGAGTTYLYSVFNLLGHSLHLYFDSACMLITLVLIGQALEGRARGRVQQHLKAFFALAPKKVRICTPVSPRGRYVAADGLRPGDVLRLTQGETSPADGVVLTGRAQVDASAVTGESRALEISAGDRIISGTRLVAGDLEVQAAKTGPHCVLGQMIALMEKALDRKTPLEGRTDRLLRWFVPAIVMVAAATAAVCLALGLPPEASLIRAVSVLVISCPCALGIAIPLARTGGISAAAKKGLLIRDFACFEQADGVNVFVFDKTGTLTDGKWRLARVTARAPLDERSALALGAALECESRHPIALELRRQAHRAGIDSDFELRAIRQHADGISAYWGGRTVRIGAAGFIGQSLAGRHAGFLPAPADADADTFESTVFMTIDGRPAAVFVFGDTLRASAAATIQRLRAGGCETLLVSGDSRRVTAAVAERLGITRIHAQLLPADKAELVRRLRKEGARVAMVGDGINDAAAMARADLALAVYARGSLAGKAAQVTLMRSEPRQVLDFLDLAARVNRKIRQNLACALVYNVISIPIAMAGLLSPPVAVCAMLLSSLSVIGNTLLLTRQTQSQKVDSRRLEPGVLTQ